MWKKVAGARELSAGDLFEHAARGPRAETGEENRKTEWGLSNSPWATGGSFAMNSSIFEVTASSVFCMPSLVAVVSAMGEEEAAELSTGVADLIRTGLQRLRVAWPHLVCLQLYSEMMGKSSFWGKRGRWD